MKGILTELHLDHLARWGGRLIHGRTVHGHGLLITMARIDARDAVGPDGAIIEIGMTRVGDDGPGSTLELAKLAKELAKPFVAVDVDPINVESVRSVVTAVNPAFRVAVAKGEEFLARYSERIAYLYLDAFDYEHGNHSEERRTRYRELLGTEIRNEACYLMHRHCVAEALGQLTSRAVVVIDDTWKEGYGWGGKGKWAVPYLQANGYEVEVFDGRAVALRRSGDGGSGN